MTNKERLAEAGVLGTTCEFTQEEDDLIEGLTEDEMDALLRVHNEMKNRAAPGEVPKALEIRC